MKLTDLDPRWLIRDGKRIGFIFKCPTNQKWYQSCMFEHVPRREQWRMFNEVLGVKADSDDQTDSGVCVQGANPAFAWTWEAGDTFDNLTVIPSIDGSAGGMWHGFITNGHAI